MRYWLWIQGKAGPVVFREALLPGLVPDHVFDLMAVDVVRNQLKLCEICEAQGRRCHVIDEDTGRMFCPVLFADATHPAWSVDQIV